MEIMKRSDAKFKKLDKYFTGKPCINNHISYRYTQSGTCSQCVNGNRVNPDILVRREIKANLVQIRCRVFDDDWGTLAASAWALAAARTPVLTINDVAPKLRPTDPTSGTAMYALYCYAEDIEAIRSIANALLKAHEFDINAARKKIKNYVDNTLSARKL